MEDLWIQYRDWVFERGETTRALPGRAAQSVGASWQPTHSPRRPVLLPPGFGADGVSVKLGVTRQDGFVRQSAGEPSGLRSPGRTRLPPTVGRVPTRWPKSTAI
jgi:hypothetical protein